MRTLVSLCAAAAAAAIAAGPASAQTAGPQDNSRTLEVELSEAGQVVASPTLRVQLGRMTAVSVGNYSFRLRMDRATAGDETAPYVIRSSVYRNDGGLLASPAVTVVQGERARLRFTGNDGSQLALAVMMR
jgi:predicted secreted protein